MKKNSFTIQNITFYSKMEKHKIFEKINRINTNNDKHIIQLNYNATAHSDLKICLN